MPNKKQTISITAPDPSDFFDLVQNVGFDDAAKSIGAKLVEQLLGDISLSSAIALKAVYDIEVIKEST